MSGWAIGAAVIGVAGSAYVSGKASDEASERQQEGLDAAEDARNEYTPLAINAIRDSRAHTQGSMSRFLGGSAPTFLLTPPEGGTYLPPPVLDEEGNIEPIETVTQMPPVDSPVSGDDSATTQGAVKVTSEQDMFVGRQLS